MKNALFILLLAFSIRGFSQGGIEINMTNLSNDSGQIIVLLFKTGQTFGADEEPNRKIINDNIIGVNAPSQSLILKMESMLLLCFTMKIKTENC